MSALEDPAIVEACLAQRLGAVVDPPLELVAVAAELLLRRLQLGGPDRELMGLVEPLPAVAVELRAERQDIGEEDDQAEILPVSELPVGGAEDAGEREEHRQDQGGDEGEDDAGRLGVEDDPHAREHRDHREHEERLAAGAEAGDHGEEEPAEEQGLQQERGVETDPPEPWAGAEDPVEPQGQIEAQGGEGQDGDQGAREPERGPLRQVRRQSEDQQNERIAHRAHERSLGGQPIRGLPHLGRDLTWTPH